MKHIKIFIVACIALICLSSCITSAYAQYESDYPSLSYELIVSNGTPYYYNGTISYYLYNGWYYYPYIWNNGRYFYPYRTPQPRGFIYRPAPNHRPMYHHFSPSNHVRPSQRDIRIQRPQIGRPTMRPSVHPSTRQNMRPNTQGDNRHSGPTFRSSTRVTQHHGNTNMHRK